MIAVTRLRYIAIVCMVLITAGCGTISHVLGKSDSERSCAPARTASAHQPTPDAGTVMMSGLFTDGVQTSNDGVLYGGVSRLDDLLPDRTPSRPVFRFSDGPEKPVKLPFPTDFSAQEFTVDPVSGDVYALESVDHTARVLVLRNGSHTADQVSLEGVNTTEPLSALTLGPKCELYLFVANDAKILRLTGDGPPTEVRFTQFRDNGSSVINLTADTNDNLLVATYNGVDNTDDGRYTDAKIVRVDHTTGEQSIFPIHDLLRPESIAVGADGVLYIADNKTKNGSQIIRFDPSNGDQTTLQIGDLHRVVQIALSPDGTLYVADNDNSSSVGRILKFPNVE